MRNNRDDDNDSSVNWELLKEELSHDTLELLKLHIENQHTIVSFSTENDTIEKDPTMNWKDAKNKDYKELWYSIFEIFYILTCFIDLFNFGIKN